MSVHHRDVRRAGVPRTRRHAALVVGLLTLGAAAAGCQSQAAGAGPAAAPAGAASSSASSSSQPTSAASVVVNVKRQDVAVDKVVALTARTARSTGWRSGRQAAGRARSRRTRPPGPRTHRLEAGHPLPA